MWRCGRGIVWAVSVIVLVCCVSHLVEGGAGLQDMDSVEKREKVLQEVSELSTGNLGTACVSGPGYRLAKAPLRFPRFDTARQKVDLLARILKDSLKFRDTRLLETMVSNLLLSDEEIEAARVLVKNEATRLPESLTHARANRSQFPPTQDPPKATTDTQLQAAIVMEKPWYEDAYNETWAAQNATKFQKNLKPPVFMGWWTFPYFDCGSRRWLLSYTVPLSLDVPPEAAPRASPQSSGRNTRTSPQIKDMGMLSVDVDVTPLDINQCDLEADPPDSQLSYFLGTHKCDRNSSVCVFSPGHGWTRGGYKCQCKENFFARNKTFNGTLVEVAWQSKIESKDPTYDLLYVCRPCRPECPGCHNDQPCMAHYNWPFRIALLTISILCILFTIVLMGMVYHYRSVKVFRLASPTFLCLCLIGCAIMYFEMAAIFPVLDMYSCVATKWTRHLGFCITFSSLLMKTWRVSLTYRVKSAHKIKLTDKQLLQWLTPVLLIMLIYLGCWTISATPRAEDIKDYNGLRFKQCQYNWWDHSLAVGDMLFLMWGVKVCFSVRKAESFFDEATYISWAVYNIAVVNIVMVSFHLLIFPNAGPDIKYLLGFLRTQFSTSVTILLIFGPKFYRIIKGTGDQYDNRARAKGVTASFSLNGLGVMNDEPADLYQENEELKEEIQKLAAQMEFMKIVHMEMNNRHLKPKPGGYFSEKNSVMSSAQSPGGKTNPNHPASAAAKMDCSGGNENSSVRLSPAAELASERV
ncbi:probable G-protein coupled receptor CG31760 [Macrobrachium rosenbergii]|uniref:probable G-protein coupled receptor CG31760 n=1 Tax=Macrobrachium rosenbergii TaxID=79674 RepID=UPI0034D6DBE9